MSNGSMVLALEVATKCRLPIMVVDNGRERLIIRAKYVERFKRVYLVFADDGEEVDVPMGCHFNLTTSDDLTPNPSPKRGEGS